MRRRYKKQYADITPDEIFVDAKNISSFDNSQYEGRLEKPITAKTYLGVSIFLLLVLVVFTGRLWNLQIAKGEIHAELSENNRLRYTPIFAERGVIFDRSGELLAWNAPNPETSEFSLRQYASSTGLAHVVGYITHPQKDSAGFYYEEQFVGKDGAEKYFNDLLAGSNGTKIVETDVHGNIQSEGVIEKPEPGQSVTLSIDKRIQEKLYSIIESTANEVGFGGGAGVILDVETGEVIALVSYPEFDQRILSSGDDRQAIARMLSDERNIFLNRATSGLYTPGSTIKPFVAMGALTERVISPLRQILSTGKMIVPNPYFPDLYSVFTDWKAHGLVDMRRALAVSSNIYFYQVGGGFEDQKGIGISGIEKYARMFGYGEPTGINLPAEVSGVIPNPEWKEKMFEDGTWRVGDTYNTSIGQYGFQVTPLQTAVAVAAIANNGNVLQPTILHSEDAQAKVKRRLDLSPDDFQVVKEGMRLAVTEGTSQGLSVPFVKLAGKTGTAELGVSKKTVNAWATGFFPFEKPKYSFVILMERGPRDNLIGGVYVMRQLLEWMNINTPEYFEM